MDQSSSAQVRDTSGTCLGGGGQRKQPSVPTKLQRRSFTAIALVLPFKGPLLGALLPYRGTGLTWLCGSDQDPLSCTLFTSPAETY